MRVSDLQTLLLPMPPDAEVVVCLHGDYADLEPGDVELIKAVEPGGRATVWIGPGERSDDDGPVWTVNGEANGETAGDVE